MRLGTTEIILIVVLALVLFGGGKLAGVGKALGLPMCGLYEIGILVSRCTKARERA